MTGAIYDADPDNPKALSLHAWGLERKARYSTTITDTQKDALRTQSEDLMRAALAADPNGPFESYLLASLEQRSSNWAEIERLLLPQFHGTACRISYITNMGIYCAQLAEIKMQQFVRKRSIGQPGGYVRKNPARVAIHGVGASRRSKKTVCGCRSL